MKLRLFLQATRRSFEECEKRQAKEEEMPREKLGEVKAMFGSLVLSQAIYRQPPESRCSQRLPPTNTHTNTHTHTHTHTGKTRGGEGEGKEEEFVQRRKTKARGKNANPVHVATATHLSGGNGEDHEDHAVEVGGRGATCHEKVHAEGSVAQVLRGVPLRTVR